MPGKINTPTIIKMRARHIAFIHVTVPRTLVEGKPQGNTESMKEAIHGAFAELLPVLKEQKIDVVGPWFAHHLQKPAENFDFEISFPISSAVTPIGRVKGAITPIIDAIQTTYIGPYEGLPEAWQEFTEWVRTNRYEASSQFYEVYAKGPLECSESSQYETELICPLAQGCYVS